MTNLTIIPAANANIVARFDDAELVAVQHASGYVGIYAEDGDDLVMISRNLRKSDTLSGAELAARMMTA